MMEAARAALQESGPQRPLLIGVTVLTSMDRMDLNEVGVAGDPKAQVERLAGLAQDSGLDGVVCSPMEAPDLRAQRGEGFLLVTPGVRPTGSAKGDQRRVTTPVEAVRAGADYLVIGRPITQARDPIQVLTDIRGELVGT